jgi:hypothetical protein
MAEAAIDLDRGVHMRTNAQAGGIQIYMYVDQPGVYYDPFGNEVPDVLAEGAGFDVSLLAKQRKLKEMKEKAVAAITEEFEKADIVGKEVVVRSRGGFTLVDLGAERHIIKDQDGNSINPVPLPRSQADLVLDQLTPGAKDDKLSKAEAEPKAK